MKLIKINTDHYVIVDDSKIKVDDWYIDDVKQIRQSVVSDEVYWQHRPYNREYMKITHSTQSLGVGWQQEVVELSLQEVKELIGEVDVEKKAERYCQRGIRAGYESRKTGYQDGYNQALEDNKDKKYTEEDLRNVFLYGHDKGDSSMVLGCKETAFQEYIQSLKPKTELEVEIVDGKLKLK